MNRDAKCLKFSNVTKTLPERKEKKVPEYLMDSAERYLKWTEGRYPALNVRIHNTEKEKYRFVLRVDQMTEGGPLNEPDLQCNGEVSHGSLSLP